MKECSVCRQVKPACEFQVRRASPDKRTAACRACLKARDAVRYQFEKGKRREWARRYYAGAGREIVKASKRRWQLANQDKRAAHIITGNAVRSGRLVKQPCEVCGSVQVHAHHDDYGFPLTVRWLCPTHHQEHHRAES